MRKIHIFWEVVCVAQVTSLCPPRSQQGVTNAGTTAWVRDSGCRHFYLWIYSMSSFLTFPILSVPFGMGQSSCDKGRRKSHVETGAGAIPAESHDHSWMYHSGLFYFFCCFIQNPLISILSFHLFFLLFSFQQVVNSQGKPQKILNMRSELIWTLVQCSVSDLSLFVCLFPGLPQV